jgi:hypothetical protein
MFLVRVFVVSIVVFDPPATPIGVDQATTGRAARLTLEARDGHGALARAALRSGSVLSRTGFMSLTYRNVKPGDHVFLVDGSNVIFRA